MENARSCTGKKRYNRLLSFCLLVFCLASTLYAQTQPFQFSQQGDFAVSSESAFTLQLIGISPSNIEIITRAFPDGVTFVSSTKSDGFVRQDNGISQKATTITYILRFSKEGTYNLGSLPIMIDSSLRSITFPIVTVFPNPNILVPELILEAHSNLYSLEEGIFTLSARYFKNIQDLHVGLSENALIEQKEMYIEMPSSDYSFSSEMIPIATFTCVPFSAGSLTFPEITVTFTAYNGQERVITLKSNSFVVSSSDNTTDSLYGNERAFLRTEEHYLLPDDTFQEKKEDIVERLVALRIQEKYSFFPFEAKKARIELESQENIDNVGETSYAWVLSGIVLSLLCLFLGFVFRLLRKKFEYTHTFFYGILFSLGVIMLGLSLYYGRPLLNQYAITYGSRLYTIPEYESKTVSSLAAGSRVAIQHSVGEWYLVLDQDGKSGWVLKNDCILIEKERGNNGFW